jgi:hypothetical protein
VTTKMADIKERDSRFHQKLEEVNRVDVWPASDFDRSYLLRLLAEAIPVLEKADDLLHEYIDTLEKRPMTRCYAGSKCRKDIAALLERLK